MHLAVDPRLDAERTVILQLAFDRHAVGSAELGPVRGRCSGCDPVVCAVGGFLKRTVNSCVDQWSQPDGETLRSVIPKARRNLFPKSGSTDL